MKCLVRRAAFVHLYIRFSNRRAFLHLYRTFPVKLISETAPLRETTFLSLISQAYLLGRDLINYYFEVNSDLTILIRE